MPEGDAVWRTAKRLRQALAGRVVTDWDLRWPSAAASDRRGRTTVTVVPRGKHLLHRLDDGTTLHTHLRMEGEWLVRAPAEVTRRDLTDPSLRALVGCATATAFGRRLGMVDLLRTRREADVVGHLGPDLLGDDWDPDLAVRNLRRDTDALLGSALLEQRNLAGIGTIWLAETCFALRLDPFTPIAELDDDHLRAVVDRAHALLTAALAFPWSTTTGDPRHPTYVHGRNRQPCRVCGDRVRVAPIPGGGHRPDEDRIAYYCPTCQHVRRHGPGSGCADRSR